MIQRCRFMDDRTGFGRFCDTFGLRVGVEVGVHRGWFARRLLEGSEHLFLHCVDPWPQYGYLKYDRKEDYQATVKELSKFMVDRCRIHLTDSLTAARTIEGPIYFVYVDGHHEGEAPFEDIKAWWPRLRPGGVMAGHDFGYEPVTEAVLRFFGNRQRFPREQVVNVIPEHEGPPATEETRRPSWWVWKEWE